MPLDYSFEHSSSFRDLTEAGLGLLRQPFTQSVRRLHDLRARLVGAEAVLLPVRVKPSRRFRRSS